LRREACARSRHGGRLHRKERLEDSAPDCW